MDEPRDQYGTQAPRNGSPEEEQDSLTWHWQRISLWLAALTYATSGITAYAAHQSIDAGAPTWLAATMIAVLTVCLAACLAVTGCSSKALAAPGPTKARTWAVRATRCFATSASLMTLTMLAVIVLTLAGAG